jgi:hypothetical protein
LFRPQEARAALALPGEAQLIIGAVPLRFFRVFAVATGLATHVVLLADAARVERPQCQELLLKLRDAPLNLG